MVQEYAEDEGGVSYRLHLSDRCNHSQGSKTGYVGVVRKPGRRKYEARRKIGGKAMTLGQYETAVEAALAYAKSVKENPPTSGHLKFVDENDNEEGEGGEQEEEEEVVEEEPVDLSQLVTHAEGYDLKLATRKDTSSGYLGVTRRRGKKGFHTQKYEAKRRLDGKTW